MQLQTIIPDRSADASSTNDRARAVRLPGGAGSLRLDAAPTWLDSEQGQNLLDTAFEEAERRNQHPETVRQEVSPIFTFVSQSMRPSEIGCNEEVQWQEGRLASFPPLPVRSKKCSCTMAQLQQKASLIQRDDVKFSQVLVSQLTAADMRTFNAGQASLPEPLDLEFQVVLKTLTGRAFEITVDSDETTEKLKAKIQKQEGIPASMQRIIFAGQEFEDARLLSDYNVRPQEILHLILRHNVRN